MSDKVDKIIKDAASNVACESKDEVSLETLEDIRNQLLGLTEHSDESFIYSLYKSAVSEEVDMKEEKKHGRK